MVKPKMRVRKKYRGYERYTECEFTLDVDMEELLAKDNVGNITVSWDKEIKAFFKDGNRIPISNIILRRRKMRPTKKEDKIISQSSGKFHDFNVNMEILEYDAIYAIDSNTKHINDKYVTICAIAKATLDRATEKSGTITVKTVHNMESVNDIKFEMIEPFMWKYAIEQINKEESNACKIGLIIDSDLGHTNEYNNRTIPLYQDYYLPENCTLMYASSDITDNWMNMILKHCDAAANRFFREKYTAKC